MAIHQLSYACCFIYALVLRFGEAGANMALPGCQSKCGDMDIPYPFGIKKGCYLDKTFEVTCNTTTTTTTTHHSAYLPWIDFDIDFISVPDHVVRVTEAELVSLSFNKSSGESLFGHSFSMSLRSDPFGVSPSRNKFIAVGCDFYAYVVDGDSREFLGGCASLCNRTDIIAPKAPSSCSGIGCCQTNFPKHVQNVTFWVETMNTVTRSWADHCGFFGVMDKGYLSFDKNKCTNCNQTYGVPLTLDWAVGDASCPNARRSKKYACGRNTDCVNNNRGSGYRCRCISGYKGNPYIPNGCQDIDECKSPEGNKCPRRSRCINTPGSYSCLPNRRHILLALLLLLGTSLAIALLVLAVGCFWIYQKFKKIRDKKLRNKFFKRNGGLLLQQQMSSSSSGSILHELILFKKEELKKATDNFSESRFLGKGGLGTVYKGMLSNGKIVAIKMANIVDESRVGQFINEVFILSQINHRHIIKLLGCCLETRVPLLVYEYVCNGTLHHHLHDPCNNSSVISWEIRLRIAAQIAGALAYLHSYASPAIFHRDIKSSNILLGKHYSAVVSDFGLSRSVSVDKTHLTTMVGGTFGYLDPEYFRSGQLNDKSDVYAFGVVLAELLTGRKAVSSAEDEEGLVICFQNALKENYLFQILDKIVVDEGPNEEIYAVAQLCERCLKLSSRKRPSMKDVAAELDRIRTEEQLKKHQESFHDEFPSIRQRCNSCSIDNSEAEEEDPIMS